METGGWTYALMGAILASGGLVLFFYRDMNTMDPWYMVLFVGTTLGLSTLVGYVLGYLTNEGLEPSSEDRE
jgi:zinc transporter ZupT